MYFACEWSEPVRMVSKPPGNPNHVYLLVTAMDASFDRESYLGTGFFRDQLEFLDDLIHHRQPSENSRLQIMSYDFYHWSLLICNTNYPFL